MYELNETVLIPQGYFPNGQSRPMKEAKIVGGFSRILYGRSTLYVVADDGDLWLLDSRSIEPTEGK